MNDRSTDKTIKSTSKFLSLVLRHRPDAIGLELDPEGWADIETLLKLSNNSHRHLDIQHLRRVVAENDKQRFAISEDGLNIRANQGHSIRSVELNLEPIKPPECLFHGTIKKYIDSIKQTGLTKQSRNHVHLSADEATAISVGGRRGKPIILEIDAGRMYVAGWKFFRSENGVWLVDRVPPEYIGFSGD